MITLTGFSWVPPFARGLVRDLRVRWALEEAGMPYGEKLISQEDKDTPAYRAIQPFGQVPVIEDGDLVLFESGAIVLRIAEGCEALCPRDDAGRAKMTQWVIAALNSVEPAIQSVALIDIFHPDEAWAKMRRPGAEAFAKLKLEAVARRLEGREYLEGRFTAGDLIMASVLRNLRHTDLVTGHPVLGPYVARCEARPAFQRALKAQLESFQAEPEMA